MNLEESEIIKKGLLLKEEEDKACSFNMFPVINGG